MTSPERQTNAEIAKATPEGVALGLVISQLGLLHIAIQTGATFALREAFRFAPPEVVATVAIVVFVGTVVTEVLYEAHVLQKVGFTANPITTLAHLKIESPLLSSLIGNLYGQLVFLVNPVDMGFSLSSLALGDGGLLLFSNLLARSLVGFALSTGLNFALYHGHAERLAAKIHELRLRATGPILDHLDHLGETLRKGVSMAILLAAYQEGSITYQEMLELIHANHQTDQDS